MKRLAIPLALCLLAGTACWPFDGEEKLAAMTLRSDGGGRVEILRASEDPIVVREEDVPVLAGDVVRTFSGGLAQVALEGERVAWVGGRKQVTAGLPEAQMRILSTTSVETETGTVMAEATDPMKVHFGDAVASASNSIFRVDRRAGAARAASYEGTVRVSAPGEANVVLERLYEAPSTASDLRPAQPYRLDPADPFDGRELSDVIELENDLGLISQGLATQLGRQKPSLSYFRAFADGKDVSALKPHLRSRPTIDLLLGFTIAVNAKSVGFGEALDSAFENRDEGGSWGVVAEIVGADPKLLVADLNNIIDASRIVAGGNSAPVFDVAAAQDASSGAVAPPPSGGGGDGGTNPDPGPGGGGGGGEKPPKEEEEAQDCEGQIDCAINDAGDQLPGGNPDPEPSPSDMLNDF